MQNSFPSGSVMTVQVMPCSWWVSCSLAPSPHKRATSAARSAAWKSRCIRFFTVFPSGTFRNSRRTGSVTDVRRATSGVFSASCRPVAAAQKAASRPGSTASKVMLVSSMVGVLLAHAIGLSGGQRPSEGEDRSALDSSLIHDARPQHNSYHNTTNINMLNFSHAIWGHQHFSGAVSICVGAVRLTDEENMGGAHLQYLLLKSLEAQALSKRNRTGAGSRGIRTAHASIPCQ